MAGATDSTRSRESRVWLIGLLLFGGALGIRLLYLFELAGTPFANELELLADGQYYDMRAREIASGNWLGDAPGFLSPLYCLVLGLVYSVVGPGVWAAKLFQALLGALSVALVYLIGRRAFSEGAGRVAAFCLALYSPHVYYTGLLLPTTLVVFLHLLLVWIVTEKATLWRCALGGLVIGLAIAAKSNAVLLLPAVAFAVWMWHRDQGTREKISAVATLTVGAVLMVAPVTIANYLVSESFLPLTTTGGGNLLKGNGPTATGTHAFLPQWAEATGLPAHVAHQVDAVEAVRQSRELTGRTLRYMLAHPVRTVGLFAKKLLLFFNAKELGIRDQYYFVRDRVVFMLHWPLLPFWFVVPLGLAGAFLAWPERRRLAVLYGVLLVQVVSFVLVFVLARYRLAFVACLMPFAAHGLLELAARVRERVWRRLAPALLVLAGGLVIGALPFSEFPRDRGFADQHKFVADHLFAAGNFESAAAGYVAALDSRWQDELRSRHLRWECMHRLALARIPLGLLDEARQTLGELQVEMVAASAGAETIAPIRALQQQIEALQGKAVDQNPQAPDEDGSVSGDSSSMPSSGR